ncbi:hypothetical protein Tco_1062038 [Tanacetum coccineum]
MSQKLAEGLTLEEGPPHNKSTFHHQDIHEEINDEQFVKEDIQLQIVTVSKVEATYMVVQDEVKQKGDSNSVVYNNFIDKQHRAKKFDVADFVMVDLRKKLQVDTYNKLKRIGPCKVVWKLNNSLYVVDLTEYLFIFSIFDVVDMFKLQDEILFYLSGNSRTSFFQEGENDVCEALIKSSIYSTNPIFQSLGVVVDREKLWTSFRAVGVTVNNSVKAQVASMEVSNAMGFGGSILASRG